MGKKAVKIRIITKETLPKVIKTLNSIQDFKREFKPSYGKNTRFPKFYGGNYVDLGEYLAIPEGRAYDYIRQYKIDNNKFVSLSRPKKLDRVVNVFNLNGEKIMTFKNVRLATEVLGIPQNIIYKSSKSFQENKRDKVNDLGLTFQLVENE